MPSACSRSVEALELDTAPRMRSFIAGQRIDELVDRGAGADADDFAGHHVLQGGLADQRFQFVLGHLRQSFAFPTELSMSLLPYSLARPFLFGLDPETAHELTHALAGAAAGHAAGMGLLQRHGRRPDRTGRTEVSQPGRPGRGPGQERPLHRRAGRHGLRLCRSRHRHAQAAARQPQAAHVPPAAGECADQPPRASTTTAWTPSSPTSSAPRFRQQGPHPRPEHRQERRHADRERDQRLPRLPGRRLSARRLRDGQHLQPEHQQPARAAKRRGAGRAAGRHRAAARDPGRAARPARADLRQDRARPRRRRRSK